MIIHDLQSWYDWIIDEYRKNEQDRISKQKQRQEEFDISHIPQRKVYRVQQLEGMVLRLEQESREEDTSNILTVRRRKKLKH